MNSTVLVKSSSSFMLSGTKREASSLTWERMRVTEGKKLPKNGISGLSDMDGRKVVIP